MLFQAEDKIEVGDQLKKLTDITVNWTQHRAVVQQSARSGITTLSQLAHLLHGWGSAVDDTWTLH